MKQRARQDILAEERDWQGFGGVAKSIAPARKWKLTRARYVGLCYKKGIDRSHDSRLVEVGFGHVSIAQWTDYGWDEREDVFSFWRFFETWCNSVRRPGIVGSEFNPLPEIVLVAMLLGMTAEEMKQDGALSVVRPLTPGAKKRLRLYRRARQALIVTRMTDQRVNGATLRRFARLPNSMLDWLPVLFDSRTQRWTWHNVEFIRKWVAEYGRAPVREIVYRYSELLFAIRKERVHLRHRRLVDAYHLSDDSVELPVELAHRSVSSWMTFRADDDTPFYERTDKRTATALWLALNRPNEGWIQSLKATGSLFEVCVEYMALCASVTNHRLQTKFSESIDNPWED